MLRHRSRNLCDASRTIYFLFWTWLVSLHVTGAVQQKQGQQQQYQALSSSLPIIDGWTSLKISSHLSYSWSHNIQRLDAQSSSIKSSNASNSNLSTLKVHRRGTALAHLQTNVERAVAQANFGLSGGLRVSNPDPVASILVDHLLIECQWGLSLRLPCTPQQPQQQQQQVLTGFMGGVTSSSSSGSGNTAQYAPLLINPGETALCSVHGLSVPAKWGTNFKQSCRVVATTATGAAAQSGHFMLNFASADVMTEKNDCVRLSTKCEISGSTFYQTPGVGEQLQQGLLVCSNRTMEATVIVNDVYGRQEEMPDGCSGMTKLSCNSDITTLPISSNKESRPAQLRALRSFGSSSSSGSTKLSTSTLTLDVIPADCEANGASSDELVLESGELADNTDYEEGPPPEEAPKLVNGRKQRPLRQPKVSVHIDGTYIVSNYTWLVSSSVAPEVLKVYANSTAAAQFSVTALRVPVRPSVPPTYFVEGTITVQNQNAREVEVSSVNAVLPWGQAALCKPADDVLFPAKVDASAKLTCTFRLQYDLGLKPSSLRAQVNLVGSSQPWKSWPKPFTFKKANLGWSAGACARVSMAFKADASDLSVTHAGGDAPDFGGQGTEVCEDFAKWDFTVLVTPVGKVDGTAMVVANTVVTPTTLPGADPTSILSRSAVTALSVDVVPWLLPESAPLLTAAGSWRRGGEVPIVSAQGGADEFIWGIRNESVVIRVNI